MESRKHSIQLLRFIVSTKSLLKEITPSRRWFQGDSVLWIIIAALAIISILVVYSSTAKMAYDNAAIKSTSQFLQQQIGSIIFGGGIILVVAHLFNTRFFFGIAPWVFLASLALTLATYFLGNSTNGAARWISIFGFQFQPSEALKVSTIMYLSRMLAVRQNTISRLRLIPWRKVTVKGQKVETKWMMGAFVPLLLPIIIACAVIVPAHTSSAILLFGTSWFLLLIGRVSYREWWKIIGCVAVAAVLFYAIGAGRSDTVGGRLSTWVELWTSDRSVIAANELTDTERSMIAIHNGGLTGVGAGKSAMRVEMIHPETDYAFAFFIEEYGAILAIVMLLLYIWIFIRAKEIFERCSSSFAGLLVLGLAMMITIQAMLHFAVTLNLMPETGQTLPLISRGGSSLIFNSVALGIILSISRQTDQEISAEKMQLK